MRRFAWFVLLTGAMAAGLMTPRAMADAEAENDARPNIVFILADDLGYGDLSGYGAPDLRSPNIDALAAEGLRFTNAYANCPVCSPTRAALLTGRYPDLVGVPGVIRTHEEDNWGCLHPEAILLPQMLRQAGYHTALVGKWHLGLRDDDHPIRRGFDQFDGFLGDMMNDYFHHRRHDINYMRRGFETVEPEGHATGIFTQWAVDYIADRAVADQPFFLCLTYNAPHTPIQPPEDWLETVMQRENGIDAKRARLVALIEHMDDGIGEVIDALKQHGVYDDTLIVFTSDNGGQLGVGARNGPLRGGKGLMYEGGIRVPQIVAWPERIEPGTETDRIMLTMDWFATLCEVAGVPIDHEIDGASMLPTILGEKQSAEARPLIWVRREGGDHYMGQTTWALRQGDWKLVQSSPSGPFELYNLADDPMEKHDLRMTERDVYVDLARKLRAHIIRAGRVPWQPPEKQDANQGVPSR